MFTDIFFIILIIVGIVASIPAAIFIIAGLIKKARATIIIGLFLALCSLFCFGFNYWYYNIHIPGIQNQEEQKDSTQFEMNEKKDEWNYQLVDHTKLGALLDNICDTDSLEFSGLYPIVDSIAADKYEKMVLADSLKSNGFTVTKWGRGNWPEGPRVVSLTLTSEACECQVIKLYYSTSTKGQYRVTERINCEKASKS